MRQQCGLVGIAAAAVVLLAAPARGGQASAGEALGLSRVGGGLCVVLGAADAEVVAGIAAGKPFLVHWLCPDAAQVEAARRTLLAKQAYGKVSVECWRGASLPYADNLVSLLLVLDAGAAAEVECLRIVRPGGELITRQGDGFSRAVKPRPPEMDEWTRWRHGPDRNAVSRDKLVDVPERIQWVFTNSIITERSHVVYANGREFAQDREVLHARDAFNGLPLWTAKLQRGNDFDWEWSVKVACLIVAKGERVYALTDDGQFRALDAATGKPAVAYAEAGAPSVALLVDDGASRLGTLVLADRDSVRALDAESGRLLWKEAASYPHNLLASPSAVFYIEGNDRRGAASGDISGRDLLTGKLLWKKNHYWARRTDLGAFGYDRIVYEMRAPHNWREFYQQRPDEKEKDRFNLAVISAKTGEEVQKVLGTGSSARHAEFRRGFWHKDHLLAEVQSREGLRLALFGLGDFSKPATVFRANYAGDRGFGHCYPPVLTERFYINGQLHFTDLETRKQASNPIARGACNTSREGYIPANGMIYTFPNHCACFPALEGNLCLAPPYKDGPEETSELVRGPAWPAHPVEVDVSKDWPTFRHDECRTGGTEATVPAHLDVLWTARIEGPDSGDPLVAEWAGGPYAAGRISAPVVAGGLVHVAHTDTHRLAALDEATGRPAGSSSPTGGLTVHPPSTGECASSAAETAGSTTCAPPTASSSGSSAWRRTTAASASMARSSRPGPCRGACLWPAGWPTPPPASTRTPTAASAWPPSGPRRARWSGGTSSTTSASTARGQTPTSLGRPGPTAIPCAPSGLWSTATSAYRSAMAIPSPSRAAAST